MDRPRYTPEQVEQLKMSRDDERTMEYRRLQARASQAARDYDGTEAGYKRLMQELEELEEFIEVFDQESVDGETGEERETRMALELNPVNPKLINELLELAQQHADLSIQRELNEALANLSSGGETASGLYIRKIQGTILPPGERSESGHESIGPRRENSREVKFDKQLLEVMALLRSLDIFGDDIIITVGDINSHITREKMYLMLEIPRIHRTIFITGDIQEGKVGESQIGEGCYVMQGSVSDEEAIKQTKQEYRQEGRGVLVPRGPSWSARMRELLVDDQAWEAKTQGQGDKKRTLPPLREKLDVRDVVAVRERIRVSMREKYTVDAYLAMSVQKRVDEIEVDGKKLKALFTIFGIEGGLNSVFPQLQLAAAVWPESEAVRTAFQQEQKRQEQLQAVETRGVEEWVKAIQKKYTAEVYLAMSNTRRAAEIEVDGKKLLALFRIFGIEGNPAALFPQLQLAAAVWPESEAVRTAFQEEQKRQEQLQAVETRGVEEWVKAIQKKYTVDAYLAMSVQKRVDEIEVDGKKLKALFTIFGIEGNHKALFPQLQLAAAVWPESEAVRTAFQEEQKRQEQLQAVETRGVEEWVKAIQKKYTAEVYLAMSNTRRAAEIEVDGKKLKALFTIFGIEGGYNSVFPQLQLAAAVWPESEAVRTAFQEEQKRQEQLQAVETRGVEEWVKAIQKKYTAEVYLAMSNTRRAAEIEVDGKKLLALFRIFGIEGNHKALFPQLQLAAAVWPESEAVRTAFQEEQKRKEGKYSQDNIV